MGGTIDFIKEGKTYPFRYEKQISGEVKNVYFGSFVRRAPAGLKTGVGYCLKQILAINPAGTGHAADRECYDLLDYEGDHLRQILARNDAAERVNEQLSREGRLNRSVSDCMVVEPWYSSTEHLFKNAGLMSVLDRLKITRQYAYGAQELHKKLIGCWKVLAHRDLKACNGVMEDLGGGRFRIRLVDFATIWLYHDVRQKDFRDQDGVMVRVSHRKGTRKLPVSPENTAPESVMSEYTISEKVDVYALGFLMASLFVRCNNAYVNLNELWCEGEGWNEGTLEEVRAKMERALRECRRKYESDNDIGPAWVERALKDRKVDFHWEDMENSDVLGEIRRLFYDSTRIDPEKRIGLNTFIDRLNQIIACLEKPENKEPRYPVAIYLFSQEQALRYKERYMEAALRLFRQDRTHSARRGQPLARALCVCYSGRVRSDDRMHNCVKLMTSLPCETEQELTAALRTLSERNSADKDCVLFGLYRAYQFLCNTDRFSLTGKVYLFCPELPGPDEVEPFVYEGDPYDLEDLCEHTLEEISPEPLEKRAFVDRSAPGRKIDFDENLLGSAGEAQTPEENEMEEDIPFRGGKPEDEASPASGFYTGEDAPFIWTKSGEKLYVAQYGR